ncbi:uncharacterized protein LOC127836209 isoform X2 [Dreissena polymorpha]|uniref:Biotin-protein ligase N-terminal domain-containing protein n=1 Tax=Dreissena polymorpha TaxID=45954 RepID=A0A9D4MVH0_DREPO|nr:uncharacterized protein LOC127836209 isoform X2 [Dreissena polymorpha]KAH3884120.1 hypothetical protein DPMN_008093 [Dreissena polymorpha]
MNKCTVFRISLQASPQAFRLLKTLVMKLACVYQGLGALEEYSALLLRTLTECLDPTGYTLQYITPESIIKGDLSKRVHLLAIGGGYDLGLIEALGSRGMANIRDFVHSGGAYLGICSGAYFACDRIEFDKDGPLQVVGDRELKFFPGVCIGPLYNPYDYNSRKGSVVAHIGFKTPMYGHILNLAQSSTGTHTDTLISSLNGISHSSEFLTKKRDSALSQINGIQNSEQSCNNHMLNSGYDVESRAYFHGGGQFVLDNTELNGHVQVLSRYLDLEGTPIAMVSCNVGQGRATLSGVHIEVTGEDIDDGDTLVEHLVPVLKQHQAENNLIFKCLLQKLNLQVKL